MFRKISFLKSILLLLTFVGASEVVIAQVKPDEISFTRQGVRRFIFDKSHEIPIAALKPSEIIGMSAMYPISYRSTDSANISLHSKHLLISSKKPTKSAIWFGGFNPFATYSLDLADCIGKGSVGFEFGNPNNFEKLAVLIHFENNKIIDVKQHIYVGGKEISNSSIAVNSDVVLSAQGKLIVQMLGSGLTVFLHQEELPTVIGQSDYGQLLDLRAKKYIQSFQSHLLVELESGAVQVNDIQANFTSGMGLADIRAITYEDGSLFLDQGRIWYTMSIRGRALPHHTQGVFSMNPSVFDLRLEGIIVFDRQDGILRNEVASHLFYDRNEQLWRGITTGFSAYANPKEKKQLLAIESKKDPRFGFSTMSATPFGVIGDIEDPHILFDSEARKWRILTCENVNKGGYKAIMLESDSWNKSYKQIAGPVSHNSTGMSIQWIGGKRYCFSGSDARQIFIYSYPDLRELGTLKMDLPPWDTKSGTRVWPNVVEMPEGYPARYIALMMDRFNFPGLKGPNWTYGAVYLYHGFSDK